MIKSLKNIWNCQNNFVYLYTNKDNYGKNLWYECKNSRKNNGS